MEYAIQIPQPSLNDTQLAELTDVVKSRNVEDASRKMSSRTEGVVIPRKDDRNEAAPVRIASQSRTDRHQKSSDWRHVHVTAGPITKIVTRIVQWSCCLACGLMLLTLGCLSANTRKASFFSSRPKTLHRQRQNSSSRKRPLEALYPAEIETAADRVISESHSSAARRQRSYGKPRRFR